MKNSWKNTSFLKKKAINKSFFEFRFGGIYKCY